MESVKVAPDLLEGCEKLQVVLDAEHIGAPVAGEDAAPAEPEEELPQGARRLQITCINCPVGCPLDVVATDTEVLSVTGNTCKRGEKYAEAEVLNPVRTVTCLVNVKGSVMPVSSRTTAPVPKELIPDIVGQLRALELEGPVHCGQVICEDICGTGVSVVATKDIGE